MADENARYWYMKEAVDESWSSRTLDCNISTQYYSRIDRNNVPQDGMITGKSACYTTITPFLKEP